MNEKQAELRKKILALVPSDAFIEASYVVHMLDLPVKLVWSEIVMMAFDGVIRTAGERTTEGQVLIQRTA